MDEEERKRREQEKYAKEQVSVHLLFHLVRNDSIIGLTSFYVFLDHSCWISLASSYSLFWFGVFEDQ